MSQQWTVRCSCDQSVAELLSLYLFDCGATAVGEADSSDQRCYLTAGFESEQAAERGAKHVVEMLPTATAEVELDRSQDDWILSQREGLSASAIGSWTIRSPWHETNIDSRADIDGAPNEIVIDPGAAFGHGGHPSTILAGELLIDNLVPNDSVVDLGAGTGVLAILAAKEGATVRAIELDQRAVEVAGQNIERNGVAGRVELTQGDAASFEVSAHELVVANVTLDVHRHLVDAYRSAERIIIAGILRDQTSALEAMLGTHEAGKIRTRGPWAAIEFHLSDPRAKSRIHR